MIDFIVDLLSGNYKSQWFFFEFWVKFLMENGIRLIIDSQSVMSNKKILIFVCHMFPDLYKSPVESDNQCYFVVSSDLISLKYCLR